MSDDDRLDRVIYLLERIAKAVGATRIGPPAPSTGEVKDVVTAIHVNHWPEPEPVEEDRTGPGPGSTRTPRAWKKEE